MAQRTSGPSFLYHHQTLRHLGYHLRSSWAAYFHELFPFLFIEVDIVLFNVDDGLSQKTVRFSHESRRYLQGVCSLQMQGTKELTSEVQFARAIASLRRIMLSS
jgi:hypothetical protein